MNLLAGYCGALGQYNTNRTHKLSYEPAAGVWSLVPSGAIYLISLLVKISADADPEIDNEVMVIDTDLSAEYISENGLQAVWDNGDYASTFSDVKAPGGIFGVDPPAEEYLTRKCRCKKCSMFAKDGHSELMIPIGRPFEKGLTVVLTDAADGIDAQTGIVWIDARYAFKTFMDIDG